MPIVNITATLSPTPYVKRVISGMMYSKGKSFLAAAILLEEKSGDSSAVLHLICQGIEIILKAVLLAINYDKYHGKLKDKLGHDLTRLASETAKASGVKAITGDLLSELTTLNNLYKKHLLRYATNYDILLDTRAIESKLVVRKIHSTMRLLQKSKGLFTEIDDSFGIAIPIDHTSSSISLLSTP
jgi:hypothetical protein